MSQRHPKAKEVLCAHFVSHFNLIFPIQKSAWNSPRLQWLRKRDHQKYIHVMPFKSIINIKSICPLAETQRPVNANEWGSKAIQVHYRVPLVTTTGSLKLSTGRPCKRQTHNSKIRRTLNDRWDTCAFCVSREKNEHKLITGMEMLPISWRAALLFINTFWEYLLRWSNCKRW